MEYLEEIKLRTISYEPELMSELEKYAKIKGDRLEEFNVAVWGYEKRHKEIDAILRRGGFAYIIEAKKKLNFGAIGQVMVYEHLYQRQHPKQKLKKGILCKEATDKDLVSFCSENDITVFLSNENGIHEIIQITSD